MIPLRALQRLDAAIASAKSPVDAGCLRAERASWLGRQGQFDAARSALLDVRSVQDTAPHPAVAAWICLAEGLIEHHSHYAAVARDRIRRAYALSAAARLRPLIALSAAWMAHLDYLYGDMQSLARHVAEALQEAADDHHAARSRACLVVASAYHWSGRLDLAQAWYVKARGHAMSEGDQIGISAMMLNRAWIGGNQARVAAIFGDENRVPDGTQLRQLMLGAESSGHFDAHVGKTSQRSLMPLLRAQLSMLQGDFDAALKLYEEQIPVAIGEGMDYMLPVFRADTAWCHVRLGRPEAALGDAQVAEAAFGADCEAEDRAIAHGRLAAVFRALDMPEPAEAHATQAQENVQLLRESQARLITLLDSSLAQVPGLRAEGRNAALPAARPPQNKAMLSLRRY